MTASKVTLFPVPVIRDRPEDHDPALLEAENDRLRTENAVLRERLTTVQAIALEREERIEDLRHALQMLPSVWAQKLEPKLGDPAEVESVEAASEPEAPSSVPEALVVEEPRLERAEILMEEIAALRARLERRRLEVEREILDQERERLQEDEEWSRRWRRRSRRAPPASL
jgi:hypothetical protein